MSAASVTVFPRRTPPTILVVEHDARLRCLVSDELRFKGYKVLEAGSAGEALTVLGAVGIDLLFLDLDLPGEGGGLEVARQARSSASPIRVILSSRTRTGEEVPDPFLLKPYHIPEVVEAIARSLNWPELPEA